MSIINFLQKNKIIPQRNEIVKSEAQRLAKRVCGVRNSIANLTNKELGLFNQEFNSEMKRVLLDRKAKLEQEIQDLTEAINKIKNI